MPKKPVTDSRPVRLTLELSPDLNETLERLAGQICGTKSDVLRKSIALMEVAVKARAAGRAFGVAKPGTELATEIVGI